MRYADAVKALEEGGWTKTHYPRWGDARAHTITALSRVGDGYVPVEYRLGNALRVKYTHRYNGTHYAMISWADNAVSADVWVSTPNDRGAQSAIVMVHDGDGKVVRQMFAKSGWTPQLITNELVAHHAHRDSPQGRQEAREHSARADQEREERMARQAQDQERLERLADDAREMLDEQGYDPTIIQVTPAGKVIIDLEDFLSILRSDAGG